MERKQADQPQRFADRTISELGRQISARNIYVGGGSAAAAAAAIAAASAELVVTLSIRKSTPPEIKTFLREKKDRLVAVQARLLEAADDDEAALANLMSFYRTREGDEVETLAAAALPAIEIAELSSETVAIAADCVEHASRFTVSDLGTAAAIGHGATTAALLTAQINISLIRDLDVGPSDLSSDLEANVAAIEERTQIDADRALAWTRQQLAPEGQDQ